VPTLGFTLRAFDLDYLKCFYVGIEPETGISCDNIGIGPGGPLVGPSGPCPSDDYWLENVWAFAFPATPGMVDCDGNFIRPECDPCPFFPCPSPGTEYCMCGDSFLATSEFAAVPKNAIQTLTGSWYLGS
jgi:hypothetical protein